MCLTTLSFSLLLPLFQDDLIEREKASYTISGGCCALAAIHLMGKLYVANAGDSRWGLWGNFWLKYGEAYVNWAPWGFTFDTAACFPGRTASTRQSYCVRNGCFSPHCRAIIIRNNEVIPMTNEFTPESERQRLQYLVRFCSPFQALLFL